MHWLELHIDTNHTGLDPVTALLSSLDIDNVMIDDEEEFHAFLEENRPHWDYVDEDLEREMRGKSRITFYLLAGDTGFAKLAEVRVALQALKESRSDCGSLLLTLEEVQDADWETSWKQYYKPLEIGERLLVIPQWETAELHGRVPLILDPGLTFGTGSHATTRLCLTALEQAVQGGERVLDLGCGSGILSIAALRLGAASARAVDIDEQCLTVARDNAALNDIGPDRYTVEVGDLLTDEAFRASLGGGYQIVLANIVADVIIALAPLVRSLMAEGGWFLCSGIIDTRADEVAEKLRAAGLVLAQRQESEGWCAFTCR
jgi:ribosomal protein L11 methyltransferase